MWLQARTALWRVRPVSLPRKIHPFLVLSGEIAGAAAEAISAGSERKAVRMAEEGEKRGGEFQISEFQSSGGVVWKMNNARTNRGAGVEGLSAALRGC